MALKNFIFIVLASLALMLGLGLNQYLKHDFQALNGETYNWHNSDGKWTIVNYFAEWCAPCLREIPELNALHQSDHQAVRLFAISFDVLTDEELMRLKDKYLIQFPIINKLQSLPWQQAPSSLPTTYILGPNGEVKKQLKGEQSAEQLKLTIDRLKSL